MTGPSRRRQTATALLFAAALLCMVTALVLFGWSLIHPLDIPTWLLPGGFGLLITGALLTYLADR